eukprot:scaffold73094_cov34-Tisochrysis_lutea.AAC.2
MPEGKPVQEVHGALTSRDGKLTGHTAWRGRPMIRKNWTTAPTIAGQATTAAYAPRIPRDAPLYSAINVLICPRAGCTDRSATACAQMPVAELAHLVELLEVTKSLMCLPHLIVRLPDKLFVTCRCGCVEARLTEGERFVQIARCRRRLGKHDISVVQQDPRLLLRELGVAKRLVRDAERARGFHLALGVSRQSGDLVALLPEVDGRLVVVELLREEVG